MPEAPAANEKTSGSSAQEENPLMNIILNVLAPVLILSYCSKDGDSAWHFGPQKAMLIALAVPICYGIWHFVQYKKFNIFSAVGIGNVLLTGIISIYLYSNDDPSVRQNAPLLFGIKEAVQPLILGSLFLITHRSKNPLFNVFVYNDGIFDHSRINKSIRKNEKTAELSQLLWSSTLLFFGSFILSSIMNMGLAYYFLGDLDPKAGNWKELYNQDVAKITGWGFAVIGLPLLLIGGFIIFRMVKGLKELTGLDNEEILQAR